MEAPPHNFQDFQRAKETPHIQTVSSLYERCSSSMLSVNVCVFSHCSHLQPSCTPVSLGMSQPSSSGCTPGRPATTPRCWESGSSSASTRSPTHSGRGWRSTSSMPGPTPMASTWTPWVLVLTHPNPGRVHSLVCDYTQRLSLRCTLMGRLESVVSARMLDTVRENKNAAHTHGTQAGLRASFATFMHFCQFVHMHEA